MYMKSIKRQVWNMTSYNINGENFFPCSSVDNFQGNLKNVIKFNEHIETLTCSQKLFIDVLKDWFNNQKNLFVLVSGGPGSGKTHTVVKTLRWIKSEIIFMAPTARLAQKIGGSTIHSRMRLDWSRGSVLKKLEEKLIYVDDVDQCINESSVLSAELTVNPTVVSIDGFFIKPNKFNKGIVVIDEVGMIPFWLLYRIVHKFFSEKDSKIMIICMGDSCQLKPVTSQYNVFQVPFDPYFDTIRIEMKESKRFTPEYGSVIDELKFLMSNTLDDDEDGDENIFKFLNETFPVVENLDEDMVKGAKRVLAYKNATVQACNEIYLNEIMKKNKLYKLYGYIESRNQLNRNNPLCLRSNCVVMVTENGCSYVSNGTSLIFSHYDSKEDFVVCTLMEDDKSVVIIKRNPTTGKFPLTLAFASTIHKFQGETIDENDIIFCFDKCRDLHLIYTALSRVRSISQIMAVVL